MSNYVKSLISPMYLHKAQNPRACHIYEHDGHLEFRIITILAFFFCFSLLRILPGRVAQSVGHLTRKSGVMGSIPGLATYFRFSFRIFKKGSCQFLAKVCARSTG